MKTEVIVVAAGLGRRLKSKIPKALILLNGKALISYSLKVLLLSYHSLNSIWGKNEMGKHSYCLSNYKAF